MPPGPGVKRSTRLAALIRLGLWGILMLRLATLLLLPRFVPLGRLLLLPRPLRLGLWQSARSLALAFRLPRRAFANRGLGMVNHRYLGCEIGAGIVISVN